MSNEVRESEVVGSDVTSNASDREIKIQAEKYFEDLITPFLERRRLECVELPRALDAADFESIARMGHRMCGNGEPLGFKEITEIGRILEREAGQKNAEAIRVQAERLRDYLDRIVVTYSDEA